MAYEACLEYLCLVEKRLSSVVLSVSGHRSCAFLCSIPLYESIWCSLHHYSNYLLAYIFYTVLVLGMKWSKNIPWATKLPGLVILAHPGGVMALWNGSILFFLFFFFLAWTQIKKWLSYPRKRNIILPMPKNSDKNWQREHRWGQMA